MNTYGKWNRQKLNKDIFVKLNLLPISEFLLNAAAYS